MTQEATRRKGIARTLVAIQFALLGLLALTIFSIDSRTQPSAIAWMLAASGVALGLWSLVANPPGNFNISPEPRPGGTLVVRGPYRWIRHPMYSSLMLLGLGAATATPGVWTWSLWAGLVLTLIAKARFEEAWMLGSHPGYRHYQDTTKRFLPGVF